MLVKVICMFVLKIFVKIMHIDNLMELALSRQPETRYYPKIPKIEPFTINIKGKS